jgi:hypothetical protein
MFHGSKPWEPSWKQRLHLWEMVQRVHLLEPVSAGRSLKPPSEAAPALYLASAAVPAADPAHCGAEADADAVEGLSQATLHHK